MENPDDLILLVGWVERFLRNPTFFNDALPVNQTITKPSASINPILVSSKQIERPTE
jgi:hypothetical protein